jgi:hypothetical protein
MIFTIKMLLGLLALPAIMLLILLTPAWAALASIYFAGEAVWNLIPERFKP